MTCRRYLCSAHTGIVTVEIERKFLLSQIPDADRLGAGEALRQGYLAEEGDTSVRVRISRDAATVTVKAGRGLSRTEVEMPINAQQAEALWPHTAGRQITKTRHRVTLDGPSALVAEVDVYADALSGLYTVEVEFASEVAASEFVPPPWFGRDVTNETSWTNAALARDGLPR
jgi:CYTH domain-containing protein